MSADERELLNNNDNNINNGNQNQLILIQRPAYSLKKFRDEFAQTHDDDDRQQNTKKNWSRALRVFASAHLNPLKLFAIINLFLHYKVKECLVPDILSGITGFRYRITKTNKFLFQLYLMNDKIINLFVIKLV